MSAPDASAAATAAAAGARHPLVARILDAAAPESLRLLAARGSLPLPVQDLLFVQVRLLRDAAPEVAREAVESLQRVTEETLLPLLVDPACDAALLDHFARSRRLQGTALEAAVAHPSIGDATLESLARDGTAETLTLIVTNEVRIIRNPRLLELLRANPNLGPDGRRRLIELERDFVGKEELRVRRPAAVPGAPAADAPAGTAAGEGAAGEGAAGEAAEEAGAAPEEPGELPPPMSAEEENQYVEALKRTPAFAKIMKLNVAERVQLAMKGSAEERAILVRDPAKLVANQVLKSPKLSDQEVVSFASMRSVTDDVLRQIATHREWTKTYAVAHALVRNPKTPPGLSVQFLARLGNRDLKMVTGDKNVPEIVRRQARNLFLARTQPPKRLGKKH
jgi:hypothetical protein